jgi:hypothetical protein
MVSDTMRPGSRGGGRASGRCASGQPTPTRDSWAKLGTAARLTIDESRTGFFRWKAHPRLAGVPGLPSRASFLGPFQARTLTSIPTTESSDEQRPRHH